MAEGLRGWLPLAVIVAAAWSGLSAMNAFAAEPMRLALKDPMRPYSPHSRPSTTTQAAKRTPLLLQSVIMAVRPVAIINGYTFVVGETIRDKGRIRAIRADEVDIDWGTWTQTLRLTPSVISNVRAPEPQTETHEADAAP